MCVQTEVLVEFPELRAVIPKQLNNMSELELKQMIWEAYKDTIYANMKIRHTADSNLPDVLEAEKSDLQSELKNAKQRSFLLDKISEVQRQFLQKKEPRTVFNYLLDSLLDLMDSEYGFIGQIKYESDGTMYLHAHAITNIAWNGATRKFYEDNVEAGLKFYNLNSLFGHVMVHAKPVVANTPYKDSRACGIPEGHPPLNHFLGIPFFEPGGTVMNGMVGIANKPGGYSQSDIEFLEPFTLTCSNLIQAYGAMQENLRFIDTLEEKVKERTFELELANVRLEKANQIVLDASAAQLKHFACMSHEIRTPLNCIVGLSSLLLETEMTSQQRDSLRMIVTSGELLSTIVNDILDYSKLISGNVEFDIQPTDLQETLDAVVHSMEVRANERKITLRTNYDPLVPKILDTDGRRVQQILYNLLGNAIKFSQDDGLVELSINVHEPAGNSVYRCEHASSEQVEEVVARPSRCPFQRSTVDSSGSCPHSVSTSNEQPAGQSSNGAFQETNRFLRIVVKDYGKGIAKADFEKIFKPFIQASCATEKIYGGTGLGLAITSKLVERFGGTISVDSEVGEFAEFTVLLPFCCPVADVETMSRLLRDTSVLIVNDDSSQKLPQSLIQAYKLNVEELESCTELLSKVMGARESHRSYLCLIHEDLHQHEELAQFVKAAPQTTVLTFGPRYGVRDVYSQGHYRSLAHLLPSSFVHSLIQAKTVDARATRRSNSLKERPRKGYENLKVLIAEDNSINQRVLKSMLTRLGIGNVRVVDDGKKAVDASAAEDWDVILMDMEMPVMDGVAATRLIVKQDHCGRPPEVVFVTANAMEHFEKEARDSGASGFITKPFTLEKIESYFATFIAERVVDTASTSFG